MEHLAVYMTFNRYTFNKRVYFRFASLNAKESVGTVSAIILIDLTKV